MSAAIVDYGMGNLGSVANACGFLGMDCRIVADPAELGRHSAVILPGVGSFGKCMQHLRASGFVDPLRDWIDQGWPFLGICLGLQVLFERSEESEGVAGMGVFPGSVRLFNRSSGLKVPQMGWNRVWHNHDGVRMFEGVEDGSFFYFVHSFYVDTPDREIVAGSTEYGITYTSAIQCGRTMAVQFHPEKSQSIGLAVLRNFGRMAAEYEKERSAL